MQHFIIESGKKRKAKIYNCKNCHKDFLGSERRKPIYCSKKCCGEARQKRRKTICANCKKKISIKLSKTKKSKSGLFFCSRECKDFAQSFRSKIRKIKPKHYKNGKYSYRDRVDLKTGCAGCKENKIFLLIVHHKDGNRENNKPSNLEVVCSNCHIKRHLVKINGEWVFNSNFLTPRRLLRFI